MIKLVMAILISYGILLMSRGVCSRAQIISKYKEELQNYMMAGYENKWWHCDLLSESSHYSEDEPQIIMDLDNIGKMNVKSTLAYSTCMLVHYTVSDNESLSALLKLGQKLISHVRMALVITMRSGITLEMATNTSNLPYLVAAESHDGKEQFLCPVVGEVKPRLRQEMCRKSYIDYKGKTLRIGLMGILPDFVMTSTGGIDGTNIGLIKMLAKGLRFTPDIILAASFNAASNQVSTLKHNLNNLPGLALNWILSVSVQQ